MKNELSCLLSPSLIEEYVTSLETLTLEKDTNIHLSQYAYSYLNRLCIENKIVGLAIQFHNKIVFSFGVKIREDRNLNLSNIKLFRYKNKQLSSLKIFILLHENLIKTSLAAWKKEIIPFIKLFFENKFGSKQAWDFYFEKKMKLKNTLNWVLKEGEKACVLYIEISNFEHLCNLWGYQKMQKELLVLNENFNSICQDIACFIPTSIYSFMIIYSIHMQFNIKKTMFTNINEIEKKGYF